MNIVMKMNNYLLSIDPSLKDTGFVLWEKQEYHQRCVGDCVKYGKYCNCEESNTQYEYKPIWVNNYNFEKFNLTSGELFKLKFIDIIRENIWNMTNSKCNNWNNFIDIYIERGFNNRLNARSSEVMGSLRGNIFGLFNKLYIPKEHGILPRSWQIWYLKEFPAMTDKSKNWDKKLSLQYVNWLINENNWNIDIKNNHNIADALLIGWYVICMKI